MAWAFSWSVTEVPHSAVDGSVSTESEVIVPDMPLADFLALPDAEKVPHIGLSLIHI